MRIFHITPVTIASGRAAFEDYSAGLVCGSDSPLYDRSIGRDVGIGAIAGSVLACIEHGITAETDIINAVARVTRCRRSTVEQMLFALSGLDPSIHLWSWVSGHFRVLDRSSAQSDTMTLITN